VVSNLKKRKQTYSRIVAAMSCFDCMTSFIYALSTWPIPKGDGSSPLYASGNTQTCTAQAFFIQLSLGAPMYNLCLAMYYMLVIKHGWSDIKLAKIERFVHSIIVVIAFGIAIAGLPLKIYGNANVWCWIVSDANLYRWAFFYVELWSIIVIVTIVMATVVKSVAKVENKTRRCSMRSNTTKSARVAIVVKRQAFYYVGAFYVTWIPLTILRILQTLGKQVPYGIFLCAVIFTPLQGFFNCLVYLRPRYLRWKRLKWNEKKKDNISGGNKVGKQWATEMKYGLSHIEDGDVVGSSMGFSVGSENGEENLIGSTEFIRHSEMTATTVATSHYPSFSSLPLERMIEIEDYDDDGCDDDEMYVDAEVSLAISNRRPMNRRTDSIEQCRIDDDEEEEEEEEEECAVLDDNMEEGSAAPVQVSTTKRKSFKPDLVAIPELDSELGLSQQSEEQNHSSK